MLIFSQSHLFLNCPVRGQFLSLAEPIAWQFLLMMLTWSTHRKSLPLCKVNFPRMCRSLTLGLLGPLMFRGEGGDLGLLG